MSKQTIPSSKLDSRRKVMFETQHELDSTLNFKIELEFDKVIKNFDVTTQKQDKIFYF